MKTAITFITFLLCSCAIQAQQIIEKHMDFSGKEDISLNIQIADSINIQTWNKKEVYVKGSVSINENKDNEAYETSFGESGKSLTVKASFRDNYFKGSNNCVESEIYWVVFIPESTKFSIETISANITINGKTEDMNVKSISGYIDLAVPADKDADLDFSTITGTIYSNHKFALTKENSGVPSRIHETLNDGGTPIKLETISGDIFFRKSN